MNSDNFHMDLRSVQFRTMHLSHGDTININTEDPQTQRSKLYAVLVRARGLREEHPSSMLD